MNFSNAAGQTDESSGSGQTRTLAYETEYILSGKPSDKENLESVLLKIFFIRMAANYLYLQGDSGKQAEAAVLAGVIAAVLMVPEAVEGIQQLILLAWAAGESVVDIRTLLSGKRAALIKNAETWRLPLASLLTLGSSAEQLSADDAEGGISYEDYLRMFLFLGNTEELTMRTLDRVEENLSAEHGMDQIKADQCITKLELLNSTEIPGGITYTFPSYFGYR